ncbi:MAG: hypothetical protein ABL994_13920 [Verrucomicrobiales bacterium]
MRSFLICLSPAVLGYAILIACIASGSNSGVESLLTLVLVLIGFGSLLSAGCVGRHVYRATGDPAFLKWFVSILSFLGVGVAYFAIATAGCCGITMMGDSL